MTAWTATFSGVGSYTDLFTGSKKLRKDRGADACFRRKLKELRRWFNPKNRKAYLGFLAYQLEQEQQLDQNNVHSWIGELLQGLG